MKPVKMNATPGKKAPVKKGAAVKPKGKGSQPAWAGIANEMLGKC